MGTWLSVTTAFVSEVLVAQIVPLRASATAFEKAVAVTPIPGARENPSSSAHFQIQKIKSINLFYLFRGVVDYAKTNHRPTYRSYIGM